MVVLVECFNVEFDIEKKDEYLRKSHILGTVTQNLGSHSYDFSQDWFASTCLLRDS